MAALLPSLNQSNRFRSVAEARGVGAADLANGTGMPVDLVERLFADERLMPDAQIFLRAGMYFWQTPAEFLSVDASPRSPWDLVGKPERAGEPFRITICGMGNLGHVLAGRLPSVPGVEVDVLVSTPERAALLSAAMDAAGGVRVESDRGDAMGRPRSMGSDAAAIVPGSDLVLFCVPTHAQPALLERVVPHLSPGALLGAIPAVGGFQWLAADALRRHGKDATIFGVLAIPWMCKTQKPGEVVRILGWKQSNGIATADGRRTREVCDLMAALTTTPVVDLGSFLQITLNPGNQILHPGIMYSLFREWRGEALPWTESPLFYEGLHREGAEILEAMSDELQAIKHAVEGASGVALDMVLPLSMSILAGYGDLVRDRSSLHRIITTNPAYAGIRTPMIEVPGGRVPDLGSRFFHEDIPYGVVVLRSLAEMAGVPTPTLDAILGWAQALMGKSYLVDGRVRGADVAASGAPSRYGWTSLGEVLQAGQGSTERP
jgi:opine dehydrogenase